MKQVTMYTSDDGVCVGTQKEVLMYEAERKLDRAIDESGFYYYGAINIDNAKELISFLNVECVSSALHDYYKARDMEE